MSESGGSTASDTGISETGQPIIKMENIRKEYPGVVANKNINLEIDEGEFFTLLGPSGCGKSTLLQIISGINTPTSGDLYISGKHMNDVKPYNRDTSLVFQEYALFPHLTTQENIEYGLKLRGIDKEKRERRAQELLDLVGLQGKENLSVSDLSGGERQRVATARSLIIEPQVLLLDEVLGALDESLRKKMQVELKRLHDTIEKTFVFVTHSQEQAFSMSDRIAIMNEGSIVQVGRPFEIYQNPANEFVANFIGMTNIIEGTVESTNDEVLEIATNWTTFTVARDTTTDALNNGDKVGFFVANERMQISQDVPNRMRGTIRDTIFKGPYTEYAVTLDESGEEIRVHESTKQNLYEEGTNVMIGFNPTAAKLLQ